ncbi:class I SAM-dependent methyltransferase [Actinomadura parmotrematis]|uniref:Class I SAM-dependent methyltransferase n=1 Tax=Actinomadura parmotrematis TaxID=2864039 RepID=A0ABS7FMY5_9ACTN|nr:class I SAM-dependent methyltransferase [Actinomadura parmotrematis]MBW8481744.1 class I SAM-dependent methyltransferase [Actinomadura parmotrematis]
MANDFDAYERELWSGRAAAYEQGFALLTRGAVGPLLDAAGVGEGTRVLDAGTGPGFVAAEAVRRGALVSALDAEPGMAETARRNVPGLDVRVAVLPDVPFPDGEFDAVAGNFVINHVSDPLVTLTELRRVLRPGGRIALTCWVMPGVGALSVVREALDAAGVPMPADIPEPPFAEHGRREPFERLVRAAGFDAVAEPLDWEHPVDAEEWWAQVALGRVGTNGVVVGRLDAPAVARVKDAYDRVVARYARGGRTVLPARALLARGTA